MDIPEGDNPSTSMLALDYVEYVISCGSSSGIPIFRLDDSGGILWEQSVEVEDAFRAEFYNITNMENGNLLCTGDLGHALQMGSRGLIVCLDPSGEETGRRINDGYSDRIRRRSDTSKSVLPRKRRIHPLITRLFGESDPTQS